MKNTQRRKKAASGFTLVEMMAVMVIVAIVCAVTVPGIVSLRYRNALIQTTSNVQEAAILVRTLAMQTRKAAVLEVRADSVFVNLLAGSSCTSDIALRCLRNYNGVGDDGSMSFAQGLAASAGVAMCGGGAQVIGTSGNEPSCNMVSLSRSGFGVCYSGMGDLYIRQGVDANSVCGSNVATPANTTWNRGCGGQTAVTATFDDSSTFGMTDGAMLILNRYGTVCDKSTALDDIPRAVFFPTGGAPFTEVAL